MVLGLAVAGCPVADIGGLVLGGLTVVVADVAHDAGTDLEVPGEDELGVTGDDVPEVGAGGVVQFSVGEGVVVVGRVEVGLAGNIPGPDTSVRALPILEPREVKAHVSPLDEVRERTVVR